LSDDNLSFIDKRITKISFAGTIIEEKRVKVQGETLADVKKCFDEEWKKE